jgi:hypothetical protein
MVWYHTVTIGFLGANLTYHVHHAPCNVADNQLVSSSMFHYVHKTELAQTQHSWGVWIATPLGHQISFSPDDHTPPHTHTTPPPHPHAKFFFGIFFCYLTILSQPASTLGCSRSRALKIGHNIQKTLKKVWM